MRSDAPSLGYGRAAAIFLGFTAYFYLLVRLLVPWLRSRLSLNPAIYWFITGYVLFSPLLAAAIRLARREKAASVRQALALKPMGRRDWAYALGGTLACFVLSGGIMAAARAAAGLLGTRPLDPVPWFMAFEPFVGREGLLLLVWLPMFALNILGEELMWRGFIQTRLGGRRHAWLFVSFFWLVFHAPFGADLMIMLLPIVLILPFAVHKTRNTTVGIVIHALYNGPAFVLIALGLVS
jgi:membrane protease YdiL (CAAX protease family)